MSAERAIDPRELARLGFVAVAAAVSWLRLVPPVGGIDLVAAAGIAAGAFPLVRESLQALRARRMTMELSMALAVAAALASGEPVTALVILAFVLGAEILEHLTVDRGRRALHDLSDRLPQRAVVERAGETIELAAEQVGSGEVVLVRPGARVPVDGEVIDGNSFVEEAEITGEPIPAHKRAGASVYAGTLNGSGALRVRAASAGRDTAFGRIVAAVEAAAGSRAPIQRIADRLAGSLVAFALAGAALTWVFTRDLRAATAALIVAGACGVAAGTPLAILGGLGRAARLGAIFKGGAHLEALARADLVAFDKTGTLTQGRPFVTASYPAPGVDEARLLAVAASVEQLSEHPLARAITQRAKELRIDLETCRELQAHPGRGASCDLGGQLGLVGSRAFLQESGAHVPGSSSDGDVHVALGSRYLGAIRITDPLRPEAREAIADLRRYGLRVAVLTGDSIAAAGETARAIGADEHAGRLLPQDKQARIHAWRASGLCVAMVGDGVNDAPALLAADVGIAVGSAADVTLESADVVLMGRDLLHVGAAIGIARACRSIILQNFAATIAVDALGMLAAAFGWLGPASAAFVHVASELLCLVNSARLLPRGDRSPATPGTAASVEPVH
jgi:heavy metal translocating P-type ATPase